jgi:hypothetical protein
MILNTGKDYFRNILDVTNCTHIESEETCPEFPD